MKSNNNIPRWLLVLAITCPFALNAQKAAEEEDEPIFELSPFEVAPDENDIGYRQQNTLAGSRLNTSLGDIAASISVITLEELEDTASVDLNDIFRYQASTEGSSTYTPGVSTLRGDGIGDVNAGFASGSSGSPETNATANSVRGLGSPDSSINFYRALRQIPLDSYNVQSIEISRGPNSMLFGVGTPAGVVNQNRSTAVVNETGHSVKLRVDDRGSRRVSVSTNIPLVEDKLAFFGAALVDNKAFERKPSYDDTTRFYGTFTYKPAEKTKLTASFENYKNESRRPNTITPIDFVTPWLEAGQPMYNPITQKITLADGTVSGPYIQSTSSPLMDDVRAYIASLPGYSESNWRDANQTSYRKDEDSPYVSVVGWNALANANSVMQVPAMRYVNSRPTMQIAGGETVGWFQADPGKYRTQNGTDAGPERNPSSGPPSGDIYANPVNAPVFEQHWTSSADYSASGGNVARFKYPGVTDQSIYDWTEFNTLHMNFGEEEAQTYNIEFEQKLTEDLYFSAGWFRQDLFTNSSFTVSQLNAPTFYVDTNSHRPDGSVNPYAGGIYLQDQDPDRFRNDTRNDQYRAVLAYTPDFTANDGWTKWLGKHQFVGYVSREEQRSDFIRDRLNFVDSNEDELGMIRFLANPNDRADGTPTGYRNEGAFSRRAFYLSNPGTVGRVDTTSGEWNYGIYTGDIDVYNWEAEAWQGVSYTGEFKPHSASSSRKSKLDSWNIGGTSRFWDGRIVATYGIREDTANLTTSTAGSYTDENGNVIPSLANNERWVNGRLDTDLILNRYRPWTEVSDKTKTTGVVFRPFSKWDSIESNANGGNVFAQFINTLGLTYNEAGTFDPPTSARVDFFGNELPKPSGSGKDWGLQFSLFENKLFARISKYESSNENEQISGGTAFSRFSSNVDQSTFRNWARTIALINRGLDPTGDDFNTDDFSEADLEALEDETEAIWGLPYDYYSDVGSLGATRSKSAKGTELELTYNPVRNWTIKLTGSKQETIYDNVLKEFTAWYDVRFPDFENARAADYLLPQYQDLATYTTLGGTEVDLTNFLQSYGYTSQVKKDEPNGNTTVQKYYDNIVTPQVALQRDLEGTVITNQSKYQAALITNYKFTGDKLDGFSIGGSLRWLDAKSIGYYGKSSGASSNPDYLDVSDVTRPIYTPAQTYTDLWAAYRTKIMDDSVDMKIQLNIVNAFESGGLQTVGVNYDGTPYGYRIIDPRKFQLSVSLDM